MSRVKSRFTPGFTFLEVILAVGIIAALISVGGIAITQLNEVLRVRAAADELRSMFQLARENSLAGKNQTTYRVSLNDNIARLETAAGLEIERYQVPVGVVLAPASLTWSFTGITGAVSGCTLPCQLSLTSGTTTEIVTITQSNIIR